jgi:hypothetical protein
VLNASPDIDHEFSNPDDITKKMGGITEEIINPKKLASSIQISSSNEPLLTFQYPMRQLQVIRDIGLLKKSPIYSTKL